MYHSLQRQAAVLWHKSGMVASPKVPSVVMAQALVDDILAARSLLMSGADRDAPDVRDFLQHTADMEQFRRG